MSDLDPDARDDAHDETWRRALTEGTAIRWKRRLRNRIPSNPRCKMCAAPFSGLGGLVMPYFGHARWAKNPKYCTGCFRALRASHGGMSSRTAWSGVRWS